MRVRRMAHIFPNHCGRFSICDLAKYTVSLFGRNSCLLYTKSVVMVVCHINLTNGWMTVLLPCQIDTRQAAILIVRGLQVLYVIVGQKPLVCWRKLNNIKRVTRNRIFYMKQFPQIPCHFNTCCTLESRHTNVHVVYLCPYLKSLGGARFSPTPISSAMFDTHIWYSTFISAQHLPL